MCNNKELFFEISKLSDRFPAFVISEKSEFTNFRLCCNNRGFLLEMVCDKKKKVPESRFASWARFYL